MKKLFLPVLCLWLLILSCQVIPTPPPLTPTVAGRGETPSPAFSETHQATPIITQTLFPESAASPAFEIEPIPLLPEQPFADTNVQGWEAVPGSTSWTEFPVDLDRISNAGVTAGLTNSQQRYLTQNGFVVIQSQEGDFSSIRHKVSALHGQPYYLTTDAASHALKTTGDALLRALEREELSRRLADVAQSTLDEIQGYLPGLQGSVLEKDAKLAVLYLSVGLRLLEPEVQLDLDTDLEMLSLAQVGQVLNSSLVEELVIFPGVKLDFSSFEAPYFYQGDHTLEAYFRGKTWFEQVGFSLEDRPGLPASRAPLIINLALQRASVAGKPSAQLWADLDETMAFFYGRSQDDDPRRYAQLIDRVYGNKISVLAFSDESTWQVFRVLAQTLPPPRAYSPLVSLSDDMSGSRDWRFLGRRYLPDTLVLSSLPVLREEATALPQHTASGLDWMAVAGWQVAEQILKSYAPTQPEAYSQDLPSLQDAFRLQDDGQRQSTFWGAWNLAFFPFPQEYPDKFPSFMNRPGWVQRNLNSALARWALAHHRSDERNFYTGRVSEAGPTVSIPAPAFVEPAPDDFYHLSYLANVIVDGLEQRQMVGFLAEEQDNLNLADLMQEMRDLGDRLVRLGDIAVKEIQGVPLDSNDFTLIQAPLGLVDISSTKLITQNVQSAQENMSVVAISVLADTGSQVLQAGTGWLDWIYVIAPIGGELQIAQGGVFSYYEFNQSTTERLSDIEWGWIVKHAQPERPAWSMIDSLPGGAPFFVLAFRKGDVYRITPAGSNLSIRANPTRIAITLNRLRAGDYVMIVDGPVEADGSIWWKVSGLMPEGEESVEGWVVQNKDWFERAWMLP